MLGIRRRKRLTFAVAGFVFLLILGFAAKEGIRGVIKNRIKSQLSAIGNLSQEELNVFLFPGKVSLKRIKCSQLPVKLEFINGKCSVLAKELKLEGVSWLGLLLHKKLSVEELSIVNPSIDLKGSTDTAAVSGSLSGKSLHAINIRKVRIEGGYFKSHSDSTGKLPGILMDTFDIGVDNFHWELNSKLKRPVFQSGELSVHKFAFSGKGFREISFRKLAINEKDSTARVEGLVLRTKYKKDDFYKIVKDQYTWFNISLPEITVHGLQFGALLKGILKARLVVVDGWRGDGFVDYNAPYPPDCYIPLPQEFFREAPLTFAIDSVSARKGHIYFEAIEEGRSEIGLIEFKPFHVELTNLTNDSQLIRKQPYLEIDTKGKYHGTWIYQHFRLNLKSPGSDFSFVGSAENLAFSSLNSFLVPSMQIKFEGGKINRVTGSIHANNHTAEGTLDVEYQDLDIAFQNKDKEKKTIWSEMVEMFFLKNDNLKSEDNFRHGVVAVKRDRCRSVFAYWWNAIRSGMLSSMLTDKTYNFVMRTNQPDTYIPSKRSGKAKKE